MSGLLARPRLVFLVASLCCLLWGSGYPSIKTGYALLGIARHDTGSQLLFAGCRFVGAGLLLLGYALFSGKRIFALNGQNWAQLAFLGVLQTTLQYLFFYVGLAHTTGVKASILSATGAFFSVLMAHFIYQNDHLSWRKAAGCTLGFVGVMVVNLDGLGAATGTDWGGWEVEFSLLGEGFIVLAALALSCASLYGRRISQTMDSVVMTAYQLAFGGAVLLA